MENSFKITKNMVCVGFIPVYQPEDSSKLMVKNPITKRFKLIKKVEKITLLSR